MKGKLLITILLSAILLSGCTQQTTDTGTAPDDGTPAVPGDAGTGQSEDGTGSETTPQDNVGDQGYEAEPDSTNLPEVAAVEAVSQSAGVARFYAVISGIAGKEIFFAKPEDPGSQGRQNNQGGDANQSEDTNEANDTNNVDDSNAEKGNQSGKGKPSIDLNALTSLEIVVSEVSIHLSRAYGGSDDADQNQVPDLNQGIPDQNQNIDLNQGTGDINNSIPDTNQSDMNNSNDTNQSNDVNANFAAEDQNQSKGGEKWIIVSDEEQIFDLLDLSSAEALLADAEIPAGQYTQIRLQIVSATAIIDGNSYEVTVPPSKLILHGVFSAEDLESVYVALDFDVGKSLKATGDGKLMLRPTIKLRIVENADVNA